MKVLNKMINIKTEEEIEIMREGGKMLAEMLKKLAEKVEPGIATQDLEKLARELISSYGVKSSFLGYGGYPSVLCISINDEIVHAIPSERKIKEGDLVKLDFGIIHKEFHTDSAITVLVSGGKDNVLKEKLLNVTRESLRIGISQAKAGNTLGDIGAAIQKFAESNGFNVVRDLVGHGIGRELHESPQVLNYGKAGTGEKLVVGMVIAIEPMVVTGKWQIKDGKDGFGFLTRDGSLAAHFEHTIVITDKEPRILTL